MKIGLILECQVDGPDENVLISLLTRFLEDVEVDSAQQGNKINLINNCGDAARDLLRDGCDRVLIVWDLHPAEWGPGLDGQNRVPCLHSDRQRILDSLGRSKVNLARVHLIAIDFMLESWLLADKRAIAPFLSKRLNRKVGAQKLGWQDPRNAGKPKDVLSKIFERNGHVRYMDHTHAAKIADEIVELTELKKFSQSFCRFWDKST